MNAEDDNKTDEKTDNSEVVPELEQPADRKPSKSVSISEPLETPDTVSRQPTLTSFTLRETEPSTQSLRSILSKKSNLEWDDKLDGKEETCDDVIAAVIAKNLPAEQGTEKTPSLQKSPKDQNVEAKKHKPDCALYDESLFESQDDDGKPCPPGVRRCCTCGVCPLDAKKGGAGLDTGDLFGDEDKYGTSKFSDESLSSYWDRDRGSDYYKLTYLFKDDNEYLDYGEYSMSDRSRHEGSLMEDYMKFFIEPIDICYKTLSSLTSSYVSSEDMGLQRTIVIIKPPAVPFKETILRVIFEEGFQILGLRVLHLTPEQVSEIFSKYYGSPSFAHLVVSVSDAPVLAICISAMNVIKRWLSLIGPDGSLKAEWFFPLSMRKMFGLHETQADWIHGSENLHESNKENRYFYPNAIIEPIIDDLDKVTDYCALTMNKSIVEACTELVKKRPADPIIFFADYLLLHNPFQPRLPRVIAMTPT